jgi:hypothetical protein
VNPAGSAARRWTVPWSLRAAFERDAAELRRGAAVAPPPVEEADLARLPAPVAAYLRFVGVVGRPRVATYELRFRGGLRNDPASPWLEVDVEQLSAADPPARLFLAEGSKAGLPVAAYHRYVGHEATFRVKAASLLTLVRAEGAEMTRSETVTLLNDMCLLAPATLLGPGLTWEERDARSVRVTFANGPYSVSALLEFDASGALVDFDSEDRSRTVDGRTYERLPWSTPVRSWRTFGGLRLPGEAEAAWGPRESRGVYARFEVLDVRFNVGPRS